jgi:hypothetical protein
MNIVILPSALDDLSNGCDFYERQSEGLGDYFLESLLSDIDSLRLYAGIHIKSFGRYRALSKRFPYAIYYDFEKETVRIFCVVDCRQDPSAIQRRLRRL